MAACASLTFYRFDGFLPRLWALTMMARARMPMSKIPGLTFWKLCGSGTGEGFTPSPNMGVYAILCCWEDEDIARQQLSSHGLFARYQKNAREHWQILMRPISVRGQWDGQAPFVLSDMPSQEDAPLAALTRASLRPSIAWKFWRRVPNISKRIGADPSVIFKIGIGELPLMRQITFSIWPDAQSMARFARQGHHAEAIKAVRLEHWFAEELYARFQITEEHGSWNGTSPVIPCRSPMK
ncbi:MAG TPA: spheroidene monooxygenase [Alphaproteobacteria bacterium]|nr:spheroidene monooxygenase [Alphaproteobacteria bacterium]